MNNLLRKYRVWQRVFAIIGVILLTKLTISFVNDTLENTALNGIVAMVGVLLLAAPRFLIRTIKERAGNLKK